MNAETLRQSYPQTVTVDQTRQILHISKRKCAWMLQNGMIPCRVGEKKTRQYNILLDDVLAFATDYGEHPEKYILPPIFTATPNQKITLYPIEPPSDFRAWLDDKWYRAADILSTTEVEKLLGYNHNSVNRWVHHKWLKSIAVHGEIIIAREWLLDFMCGYGWRIANKSEKHMALIEKYNRSSGCS